MSEQSDLGSYDTVPDTVPIIEDVLSTCLR